MTEKFYKNNPESLFQGKKARLTQTIPTPCGNDRIEAGWEVEIKRKYTGLGCYCAHNDVFIAYIDPKFVELIEEI